MQILRITDFPDQTFSGAIVTIGNFDGVHLGHIEIFRHLVSRSLSLGLPSVVLTFEPHPLVLLAPEAAPRMITTFDQKSALIAEHGVDYLVAINFDTSFSQMSADDFVRDILCISLKMRHIIIGHDYCFGRERSGNFATLEKLATECAYTVEDLDPIGSDGAIYSSSLVRRLIAAGDMPGAASILGRCHSISGRVVHGREIGQLIGYPTANIVTNNELVPPDGVYAVKVKIGASYFNAACSIGNNPTFKGASRSIEVFIFDFSGDLYDMLLEVQFVRRIRDVRIFSDRDALAGAIADDILNARQILTHADCALKIDLHTDADRSVSL